MHETDRVREELSVSTRSELLARVHLAEALGERLIRDAATTGDLGADAALLREHRRREGDLKKKLRRARENRRKAEQQVEEARVELARLRGRRSVRIALACARPMRGPFSVVRRLKGR